MPARFKIHFKQLVLNKAAKSGDQITLRDIQEATGLSQPTVARWWAGNVDRIEPETIYKLTGFLKCDMNDLLTVVMEND